jgi:cytochrome b
MGGWSVVALLGLLVVEVVLGLFAVDVDGDASGPLSGLVSFDAGRIAAKLHHQGFNILLGLIALHLGAVAFYLIFRRDNLVAPMITGRRKTPGDDNEPAAPWRLAVALTAGAAVAILVTRNL